MTVGKDEGKQADVSIPFTRISSTVRKWVMMTVMAYVLNSFT